MTQHDTFADRLRSFRERNGWSAKQVSEWTGIPAAQISHYECGRREPSFDNLKALCNGLRVSSDWLLGLKENL